jgi:hypothetical protein
MESKVLNLLASAPSLSYVPSPKEILLKTEV